MAAKQEVTAEEGLTVKTQARAPSAGVVLQNPPPPLGATPATLRGRPHGRGAGRSGLARWNSSMSDGSRISEAGIHDLSSDP